MNPVLERLYVERQHQVDFIDELLARVDADGRDLVEAEQSNLSGARERITALDAQIGPLEEFEAQRETHRAAQRSLAPPSWQGGDTPQPLGARTPEVTYSSPGAFLVDYISARGMMADRRGQRLPPAPEAVARVEYALANQTTDDTPGLLPHPIIGAVVSLIDASRPLISGLGGARSMGGVPGKTFGRPKVTQHVIVGPQSAEKAELPTREMTIGEISFTKGTFGGAVDVSRQDIDWTSPAAWDILIRDLADVYAIETEEAVAAGFVAAADDVNAATAVGATNDLAAWATALYAAAGLIYASAKRLPDRIFCSVDIWGMLGPLVDNRGLVFGPSPAGSNSLDSFAGNMLQVPRIVVPAFPDGTCIVASAGAYEVYEEVIGLLTAVEPSLLGVEVAYGGYIAHNAVIPEAMALVTAPAGLPLGSRGGRTSGTQDRDSMTVAELQAEAGRKGLPTSGTKAELIERLEQ